MSQGRDHDRVDRSTAAGVQVEAHDDRDGRGEESGQENRDGDGVRGQGRQVGGKGGKEDRRDLEHHSTCLFIYPEWSSTLVLTVSQDMRNTSSEKLPFACCDAYRL